MKVMIDDVEYVPIEPALDLFGDGIKHACKMLVRYMERENEDLMDYGASELVSIVRGESRNDA